MTYERSNAENDIYILFLLITYLDVPVQVPAAAPHLLCIDLQSSREFVRLSLTGGSPHPLLPPILEILSNSLRTQGHLGQERQLPRHTILPLYGLVSGIMELNMTMFRVREESGYFSEVARVIIFTPSIPHSSHLRSIKCDKIQKRREIDDVHLTHHKR